MTSVTNRNVEPKLGQISTCWYKTNLADVISEASSSRLAIAYISRELIEKYWPLAQLMILPKQIVAHTGLDWVTSSSGRTASGSRARSKIWMRKIACLWNVVLKQAAKMSVFLRSSSNRSIPVSITRSEHSLERNVLGDVQTDDSAVLQSQHTLNLGFESLYCSRRHLRGVARHKQPDLIVNEALDLLLEAFVVFLPEGEVEWREILSETDVCMDHINCRLKDRDIAARRRVQSRGTEQGNKDLLLMANNRVCPKIQGGSDGGVNTSTMSSEKTREGAASNHILDEGVDSTFETMRDQRLSKLLLQFIGVLTLQQQLEDRVGGVYRVSVEFWQTLMGRGLVEVDKTKVPLARNSSGLNIVGALPSCARKSMVGGGIIFQTSDEGGMGL
ncbi:hypothetical protein DFH08DRAFT_813823 [Mycena albidolilacea]|uniref:Uncharacterized protein n=1 Tax=Mycena albidolilacea TaxID=1033008 RepID=A0AAD7EL96_9AGAR|nr:hypothetical protein DFH08DRAFT_813823 [Mycena albidolilacea]